ncbi:MAG: hypothetical protein GXY22_02280 [Clostridiaceae bacterium]|nr:hypothetical protein [Clostridiaceae bacterium]
MSPILQIVLTLVFAAVGGLLGKWSRIPAGTILGALLFTIVLNLVWQQAYIPADFRPYLQMISGVLIGSRIKRKDILELKRLLLPGIIMLVCMIFLNLIFGYLMFKLSKLDLATSLLATAPGGMTDMALIAPELGGETLPVSLLHLVRILVIYAIIPLVFSYLQRYQQANGKKVRNRSDKQDSSQKTQPLPTTSGDQKKLLVNIILTLTAAAAGGILLWKLGINAGAMIGSMLAVALLNLLTDRAWQSSKLRIAVQILAGAYVGQNMTRNNLSMMLDLLIPILIMIVSVVVFIFLISTALIKLSKLDRVTSFLVSAPGGLQEVSLMAMDLDADAPKVMILQSVRLMVVIATFPGILSAFAGFVA